MSQGKNVKAFKQRVRENSAKFAGSKKPSGKISIVTKTGDTEEKLIKVPTGKKSSANRARKTESFFPNNTRMQKSLKPRDDKQYNKTPHFTKKPNTKKASEKRPVKNLFFPDNIKNVPTDKHIAGSKTDQVTKALLNPYYAAMNTHIDNAINFVKEKCVGRTSFKVTSNRTKWNSCHAITFDIRLFSMTDTKKTRDLLIYFVKSSEKEITVLIANGMADSSAVVYHYSGLVTSCSIGQYLPKILESTEKLFSGIKNEKKADDTINNEANGGNEK